MNHSENPQPKPKSSVLKYLLFSILGFTVGFILCAGSNYWLNSVQTKNINIIDTALLNKVQNILQQKFDGEINLKKQSEGAAAGAVSALNDPYTVYLDETANKELNNDLKGELSGVGIEVGQKNGKLTVIAPIDGTPAAEAGIKSGDFIAMIDSIDSRTLTIDEAVNKIRGPKGTQVKLTIVRGSESPKELIITRDIISVPSVVGELKSNNTVGYIKIRRFGEETASSVRSTASNLITQGVKSIVLDLRDNPGGFLQSSVDIASLFIDEGVIVEERSKHTKTKVIRASGSGFLTKIPITVLINGGSASAAEILAGALQDNGRAKLVGEKSYGKGSVQEIICLSGLQLSAVCEGASLKVTVAHWFTPKGVNISKDGIKPDIEIKLTPDDSSASRDPQLQKALELAQ